MRAALVKSLASECGFELAGVASAEPIPEGDWYQEWVRRGMAGEMAYLTDHRATMRADLRSLLPSVRSVVCVGKLYNVPEPYSNNFQQSDRGWISRYAWGQDYHRVMRKALRRLAGKLSAVSEEPFQWRICVDTAPVMERAYARRAGLGWIGRNSCLINQQQGSWFFLGELLVSLELESDYPPTDRCGTCRRCIEACPTRAILPTGDPGGPAFTVDSRRCISYLTIELRGEIPKPLKASLGSHVFGCDICQEVCPWSRRAGVTRDAAFAAVHFAPPLDELAGLSKEDFDRKFRHSPVRRCGHDGLLRNVSVASSNARARMEETNGSSACPGVAGAGAPEGPNDAALPGI